MNNDSTAPARDICVAQVALNTCDLPGSLRLFHELFGLRNAGASCLWGDIMRVQGLAPDARGLIWWMVGGAPFFQLEIFQHTRPAQRPLPPDWRPCDHGWVRRVICDQGIMNVALGSRDTQVIDAVIARARAHGNTLTEVFRGDGTVGTYIVDPGCEIELLAAAEKYDRALGFAAAAPFLGELSLIRP